MIREQSAFRENNDREVDGKEDDDGVDCERLDEDVEVIAVTVSRSVNEFPE